MTKSDFRNDKITAHGTKLLDESFLEDRKAVVEGDRMPGHFLDRWSLFQTVHTIFDRKKPRG